jgi:hypothetical protein
VILFRIITGPDTDAFYHQVTLALNNGWTLAGNVSVTYDPERGRAICGQPLTKDVPGVSYVEGVKLSDYY